MQASLFQQGIELMLYGMGTVFVFLMMLILATVVMSSMVQRFAPADPIKPLAKTKSQTVPATAENERLLAVITTAVHKYRSRHE